MAGTETSIRPPYPGQLTAGLIGQVVGRACRAAVSLAIAEGNPPFACAVTDTNGDLVVVTHNTTRTSGDPTAHAEVNAIRELGGQPLDELFIFSNAVSCVKYCFPALLDHGARRFFFGTPCGRSIRPWASLAEMRDMLVASPNGREKGWLVAGIEGAACQRQIERGRLAVANWLYRSAIVDELERTENLECTVASGPYITEGTEGLWYPGIQAWPAEGASDENTLIEAGVTYNNNEIAKQLLGSGVIAF